METEFDVIVIGAGHAGVEAAHASARLGRKVLLTTIDINNVAFMACNPSIGGVGKSHLVYEIDALGGVMGSVADKTCIQMRTLNRGNGPAVQALRAQIDKHEYHATMLELIRNTPNITLRECEVAEVLTDCAGKTSQVNNPQTKSRTFTAKCLPRAVTGVKLTTGETIRAKSVVVATGVYLNSTILIGHTAKSSGPSGFANATHLTKSLIDLGVTVRRFKTGTPPRVTSQSIDYTKTIPQPPDTDAHFSTMTTEPTRNVVSCHLTYTNERTHQIIRDNIEKSAMYGGLIKGIGARYCPSIEDKITRFANASRHQIFLEPESLSTDEIYLQGISTSLPADIQKQFVQTIDGLENANIVRDAYAIEYDCIDSTQLDHTLQHKDIKGLYFAGQVNGTSGYEEAAAQGLVAGANAGLCNNSNNYNYDYWDDKYWNNLLSNNSEQTKDILSDLWIDKYSATINKIPKGKALDLGCGIGQHMSYLISKGFATTACDISKSALTKAKQSAPSATIIQVDMQKPLPFKDGEFDLVFANLSIHYFDTPTTMQLLREIRRILKKDGYFIGSVNSTKTIDHEVARESEEIEPNVFKSTDDQFVRRFWDLTSFNKFFTGFNIKVLEEVTLTRKGKPKIAWEFVARKEFDGYSNLVLSRTNSYIGVLVDDLVTLGTNEPYRMFTSRAEHRLYLRKDNADTRLTPLGRELGLVDDTRWNAFNEKQKQIAEYKTNKKANVSDEIKEIVEIEQKYAGYMKREQGRINEMIRCEQTLIPRDIDYDKITALRRESQIKLAKHRPENIASAMRISGVTPADINVLLVYIKRKT